MGGRNRSWITVWLLATLQRKPEKTERGGERKKEKDKLTNRTKKRMRGNKKRDNERKE